MADDPFDHRSIHARVAADVLRIQSEFLEWSAEPTEEDFDTKIVKTLVSALDAHARGYLAAVDRDSLIPEFTNALRRIGSALEQNAEQRSFLSDPYCDARLRKMAESSGEYIQRRHSLTAEQQEAELHDAVERIRREVMEKAPAWHRWKNQILVRIETSFEARYRHWTAEALDRLRHSQRSTAEVVGTGSTGGVFISYSWESEEHQAWVAGLAARLRADGVEAIIDKMHLQLGARSPEFMERSVRESGCVLVVCTEIYKRRFDDRQGGAGYEGHIITGEIINEVGKNKFIPVLRNGDWKSAVPTALAGVYGVDLRGDSEDEYRTLVRHLHGVSDIPSVGPRPDWIGPSFNVSERPVPAASAITPDLSDFIEQRKRLPDSPILTKIWSKPRWRIWICPAEFKKARFQNLEQCREFMRTAYVRIPGWFPYPWFSTDSIETGDEWIAGEADWSMSGVTRVERWVLFRSGQFVHNRALDEIPLLAGRVDVLEILETTTAVFEFASRMAHRGVLSPQAVVVFELCGVDGRGLAWLENTGRIIDLGRNCWCPDEKVNVGRQVSADQVEARKREYALDVALEVYARFGWQDPPRQRLTDEQDRRLGAVQQEGR